MRQIYPLQGPELELLPTPSAGPLPAAISALAQLYRGQVAPDPVTGWLRANVVASTDGAASLGGRSGGLSGAGDRMIFNVLRSLTDLILVGAGTVRAEKYRSAQEAGLWTELRPAGAPVPTIGIVTASLDLDPESQLFTAAGPQPIVITTASAPAGPKAAITARARIIEAGEDRVDVVTAVAELRRLGFASILCEGGPTLLGQLADAGLVDELCLTTTPVLAAGPAGRVVTERPLLASPAGARTAMPAAATATVTARLTLAHVLTDESFLFSRYLRESLSA